MANTFFGLNIGTSGLYAANTWLNVTANNSANAATEGYSKQTATQQATKPLKVNQRYGMIGSGVEVTEITRSRDEYYDTKYWNNQYKLGEFTTKSYYLKQMEDYFADNGESGFTTEYGLVYKGLEELAKQPAELSARKSAINYMESFLEYMKEIKTNLLNTQADLNAEVSSNVDHINSIAEEIATINKQINTIELQGANANELRDKRALLIDDLSQIIEVDTKEVLYDNGKSEFYVTTNGKTLVSNYDYYTLKVVTREEKADAQDLVGLYNIEWSYGEEFNPGTNGVNGTLCGLIQVRDGNNGIPEPGNPNSVAVDYKGVPYYIDEINSFLDKFTESLNEVHAKGVNLNGEPTADIPIFVKDASGEYVVNPDIVEDPNKLATSTWGKEDVEAGDIIKELIATKNQAIYGGGTAEDELGSIIAQLAVDSRKAQTLEKNYTNMKNTISNQRLSFMGVDKDEEAVNLVKYREAYNLSAKVIQVMSEIYDKLINETGV